VGVTPGEGPLALFDDPPPCEELGEVDGGGAVRDRAPGDEQAATPTASAKKEIVDILSR